MLQTLMLIGGVVYCDGVVCLYSGWDWGSILMGRALLKTIHGCLVAQASVFWVIYDNQLANLAF